MGVFCLEGEGGLVRAVDLLKEPFNKFNLGFNCVKVDGFCGRSVIFSFDVGRPGFACENSREVQREWYHGWVFVVSCKFLVEGIVEGTECLPQV